MPGYRSLSTSVTGAAADSVREADSLRREGDPRSAVVFLEEALTASLRTSAEMPGWLCGRLAALYRTVGRHDDEVLLLERYRDSQQSEEARSRFDARLSKARTIAERKRRSDSGALTSVRKVMGASRRRGATPTPIGDATTAAVRARPNVEPLAAVLGEAPTDRFDDRLKEALTRLHDEARASDTPVERLVDALRMAAGTADTSAVSDAVRAERYSVALVRLLALCYDDAKR